MIDHRFIGCPAGEGFVLNIPNNNSAVFFQAERGLPRRFVEYIEGTGFRTIYQGLAEDTVAQQIGVKTDL